MCISLFRCSLICIISSHSSRPDSDNQHVQLTVNPEYVSKWFTIHGNRVLSMTTGYNFNHQEELRRLNTDVALATLDNVNREEAQNLKDLYDQGTEAIGGSVNVRGIFYEGVLVPGTASFIQEDDCDVYENIQVKDELGIYKVKCCGNLNSKCQVYSMDGVVPSTKAKGPKPLRPGKKKKNKKPWENDAGSRHLVLRCVTDADCAADPTLDGCDNGVCLTPGRCSTAVECLDDPGLIGCVNGVCAGCEDDDDCVTYPTIDGCVDGKCFETCVRGSNRRFDPSDSKSYCADDCSAIGEICTQGPGLLGSCQCQLQTSCEEPTDCETSPFLDGCVGGDCFKTCGATVPFDPSNPNSYCGPDCNDSRTTCVSCFDLSDSYWF